VNENTTGGALNRLHPLLLLMNVIPGSLKVISRIGRESKDVNHNNYCNCLA
jgi:hypothetical protein